MNNLENINHAIAQDEVALKEVLTPLWSRKWKILFFTLLMTSAVAFYLSLLKPSFKATAILQIGSNKPANTLSINDAFNESNASHEQVQTQYELLRSRKFAERVITKLNLTEHEEFFSGKYNDKMSFLFETDKSITSVPINQVVSGFQQRLTIAPIAGTELVKITFVSYSPDLSRQVANQIGNTYLQYQDEIHSSSKESTSQWLVDQLQELGKKLEVSEQALQKYREQEGLVDVRGVAGLVSSELTELTSSALRASKKADDLKVTYQYTQSNRDSLLQLVELNEVGSTSSYVQLRRSEEQLERRINELSQRYGPKHPKMISVQAELKSLTFSMEQRDRKSVV